MAEGATFTGPPAVGRVGGPDALATGLGARPGAAAAVQPASAVRHRRLATGAPCPGARPAARRNRGIAGRHPILQPVAPLGMGFYRHGHGAPGLPDRVGSSCRCSRVCSVLLMMRDSIAAEPSRRVLRLVVWLERAARR